MAAIFAAGIVVALLIARYLYSPLKQLTDTILNNQNLALTAPSDLDLIRKALTHLISEEERLKKALSQRDGSLGDDALRAILYEGFAAQGAEPGLIRRFEMPASVVIYISDDSHVSTLPG
jgi:hypothetical protein